MHPIKRFDDVRLDHVMRFAAVLGQGRGSIKEPYHIVRLASGFEAEEPRVVRPRCVDQLQSGLDVAQCQFFEHWQPANASKVGRDACPFNLWNQRNLYSVPYS